MFKWKMGFPCRHCVGPGHIEVRAGCCLAMPASQFPPRSVHSVSLEVHKTPLESFRAQRQPLFQFTHFPCSGRKGPSSFDCRDMVPEHMMCAAGEQPPSCTHHPAAFALLLTSWRHHTCSTTYVQSSAPQPYFLSRTPPALRSLCTIS